MQRLVTHDSLLLALVLLLSVASVNTIVAVENNAISRIEEWDKVPATDAEVPSLTTGQLRAEFAKVSAACAKLTSWEARCRVTTHIDQTGARKNIPASAKIPDHIDTTHSTLLVCSGRKWFSERRVGEWQDEKIKYRKLCDGERVLSLSPGEKWMNVQSPDQFAQREAAPVNWTQPEFQAGFPPFSEIRREHQTPPGSWPDVEKILADPDARVLPWRTRVNGHVCYVVERTTVTETPIFRSLEEADAWQKAKPDGRSNLLVNPNAKPDDKRIDKWTVRVALDPQSGFMPVRCATGAAFAFPGVEDIQGPSEDIACTDFRGFGDKGYVAGRVEYAKYAIDRHGKQKVQVRQEVVLEDFQVNREYPPAFFSFDPPQGYQVADSIQGIAYSVGDSEEQLATQLAAARTKKAFFEALKKKPVPPLEAALWLNSDPIRLETARGKQVRLHFWSMGCGPCVHELPQLQEEWERERQHEANAAIFISIHPYVDGDELQQLKDFLRKHKVTFPVMVDSRAPDGNAWGNTCAYYHVYSVPSEAWIDDEGNLVRVDSEDKFVGKDDWWMNNLTKNEREGQ